MKPAFTLSGFFAAVFILGCASQETASGGGPVRRDFAVSNDPTEVIMTMGARDMVHPPGSRSLELFGDGWLQRRSDSPGGSSRIADGIRIDRSEIEAAFADVVDFGLLEADLGLVHDAVQPAHGVLPDGRRWVQGSSEPDTGWSVTMHFDQVQILSETRVRHRIQFSLEPFVRYRKARMDIPAIEGIARIADRMARWIGQLEEAERASK